MIEGVHRVNDTAHRAGGRKEATMNKLKSYAKFAWLYTTSMFLPTAIVTPRVEAALKEIEEEKRRDAERRARR